MNTEICYPFQIDSTGDLLTTSSRAEHCRQAILSALYTQAGERVYRQEYGLGVRLFTSNQVGKVIGDIKATLRDALDPEYSDCVYQVRGRVGDDGRFIAVVTYQIDGVDNSVNVNIG